MQIKVSVNLLNDQFFNLRLNAEGKEKTQTESPGTTVTIYKF
jgi:hypothetical protein